LSEIALVAVSSVATAYGALPSPAPHRSTLRTPSGLSDAPAPCAGPCGCCSWPECYTDIRRMAMYHILLLSSLIYQRVTAGNLTTRKSVGGCVFGLGHTGANEELVMSGPIHWQAKSQSIVALSTLEAEYLACSHATRESLWLRRMMKEAARGMAVKIVDGPVPIGCDNQGAIKLITSGVVRQKSKHIDVKYHHVHDEQMKGAVKFQYVT